MNQVETYSQLQSPTEFHHHLQQWLLQYKQGFSKGEGMGVNVLCGFAERALGEPQRLGHC